MKGEVLKLKLTERERQEAIKQRLKKRLKKLELKRKLGLLGRFISFEDHVKEKQSNRIIEETKNNYGRSGNRIYVLNDNGEFMLFKKLKNSTKAKKYFAKI